MGSSIGEVPEVQSSTPASEDGKNSSGLLSNKLTARIETQRFEVQAQIVFQINTIN